MFPQEIGPTGEVENRWDWHRLVPAATAQVVRAGVWGRGGGMSGGSAGLFRVQGRLTPLWQCCAWGS